ncbi:MAG: ABC transporter permease [Nocardioides sp.]|uniref:FtsX-like permease family protein n=1 Tax=Nocardioides sp. TaxID=35761 RepID=UPI0039E664C9
MWSLAWRRLQHRGARTLVLGFAILVAATGFTVLTASSNATRLQTIGTVRKEASSTYDILVRPSGSRSKLEESEGEVQPGFLNGIYGGITMAQWRQIQHLSGVEVAAPIAMLGYAYPSFVLPIDTRGAWSKHGASVARVDVTWSGDNGLTLTHATPDYAIVTGKALEDNTGDSVYEGYWHYVDSHGDDHNICPHNMFSEDQRPESKASWLDCFSRTRGGLSDVSLWKHKYRVYHYLGVEVQFSMPYVVAAVDPASEDALVGLDGARSSGKSLVGATTNYPGAWGRRGLPVLASDDFAVSESARVTISTLPAAAARAVMAGKNAAALSHYRGRRYSTTTVSAKDAHQLLMKEFRTAKPHISPGSLSKQLPGEVTQFVKVSQPRYQSTSRGLRVELSPSSVTGTYNNPLSSVAASDEPVARTTTLSHGPSTETQQYRPVTLRLRGTFDPAHLTHISDLTDKTLAGYATALSKGADAASRKALGDQPLHPSNNAAGLVQSAPTMITSLSAANELMQGWDGFDQSAPISAIRVRVEGAGIYDDAARERIRLTAQRIQEKTGLDVDITTGASTTTQAVTLPQGKHGRPELHLTQSWVKKGVATAILKAVDKKSLVLFSLVLLVSALSIANATVASVRARRTELGVLACLGWRRSDQFRSVLYELGMVACVAGILSVGLALGLGQIVNTPVSLSRALLALPAALAVALLAGAAPALLAAQADPIAAVRPVVSELRRPHRAKHIVGLAGLNLTLTKTRAALAAAGLLIAVATTTTLVAIMLGFQGAVVGTVLGDTVTVQTRTADYAATAATLLLACLGVTNVMYLNIRDRGIEIATLRAVGWSEHNLAALLTAEGTMIGLLGTVPGVLLGLCGAILLAGTLTPTMLTGALLAWLLGTVLAGLSAYAATVLVRRLPTADLLTE